MIKTRSRMTLNPAELGNSMTKNPAKGNIVARRSRMIGGRRRIRAGNGKHHSRFIATSHNPRQSSGFFPLGIKPMMYGAITSVVKSFPESGKRL
jgi:hypothetical protein